MSNINWKERLGNKAFWISMLSVAILLIQAIAKVFGYTIDLGELGNNLKEVINLIFVALALLGVVVDPTTPGVTDSDRALTYGTSYDIRDAELIGTDEDIEDTDAEEVEEEAINDEEVEEI